MFGRASNSLSFERVRLRLMSAGLLSIGNGGTAIALTSRTRGEGVSTVAAGLVSAMGIAEPGHVLVLDVDSSNKRVRDILQVQAEVVKLEDLGETDGDVSERVTRIKELGVDLLAVTVSDCPPVTLAERTGALLEQLRARYRITVIDVGAISGRDAHCWLTCGDHSVLVVDTTTTTREALERLQIELEQFRITLSGFILNKRAYHVPELFYRLLS